MKRKRAACLLQMMVIYGTCCLWFTDQESAWPKQLPEQLVQVLLNCLFGVQAHQAQHREREVVLKITSVRIIPLYSKLTPHILRSNGYQFGDHFPMLWPVSESSDIILVALLLFSHPIQRLCLSVVHWKKHFDLLRETLEKILGRIQCGGCQLNPTAE